MRKPDVALAAQRTSPLIISENQMTLKDLYAYLAYFVFLVWMFQGGRLLAMITTGNWDKSPPLAALIPAFLRRRRPKR